MHSSTDTYKVFFFKYSVKRHLYVGTSTNIDININIYIYL
jgi:hypothetical protein